MALPAQKFREIVFQILYSSDMTGTDEEVMVPFMMGELKVTKRSVVDAYAKMHAVLGKGEEIDSLITKASKEYDFARISRVEKNIMRLGIFEMLFDDSIPDKVAMAEAIRLTRKFGTPESAQFVNAIMDAVYHERTNQPVPQ